ncbi:MAG: Nudix family hydrolase [Gammaproteobacteria bacterium]
MWEFPGGKVETGESPECALKRELLEELGVELERAEPLIQVPHTYPEKSVLLDVWQVTEYGGMPRGMEGQELVWVEVDKLAEWQLPPADRPIVAAIRLPDRYLITPEPGNDWAHFLDNLSLSISRGVSLIQLRAHTLPELAYKKLAEEVLAICRERGVQLLLNRGADLVGELGADGIHLSSDRLRQCPLRPLNDQFWVAASCHDQVELKLAESIGADFAVLGPVRVTASHPESSPLGWKRFGDILESTSLPVYALGGMSLQDIGRSQRLGGQGIAAIRSLWGGAGE